MFEIKSLTERYPALEGCRSDIEKSIAILTASYRNGGKLLVCGNGGSASDALHIVGELMKGFVLPRHVKDTFEGQADADFLKENLQGALPAIALVNEVALQTAYANDMASDLTFAQQVYGYGNQGDVLMAISTSGNSKNCIYATEVARAKGMKVISLTGVTGGKLKPISDVTVCAPATETYQIQEYHLPIYHAICLALEEKFFGGES